MKKIAALSQADIALVRASDLFDATWYLAQYPDVKLLDIDPVEHFLWIGSRMGRSPSARFSAPSYLEANRDVKVSGLNPLLHYLLSGREERRPIQPEADETSTDRKPCRRRVLPYHETWDASAEAELQRALLSVPAPFAGDKVSVIMPTWNRAQVIGAAIHSVLAQSHHNIELIVVDDHSTDETASVVQAIRDPRITFVRNRHSKGVCGARNTGLDAATGDWVFFLDSDNQWKEEMVAVLLRHAAHSQSSAGYCAASLNDDEGQRKAVLYADFDFDSCLRANFIDLNAFFMRWTGAFRCFRFDETLRRLVDWELILRVALQTRVTGLPWIGVEYHDGTSARITTQEHTGPGELALLQDQVRGKVLALSGNASRIRDASSYRIAVVLHVFHPERVPDCVRYLRRIGVEFDLFVTTSLEQDHECLAELRAAFPTLRRFFYPNIGSDIGPFLALVPTLGLYELVLKIHTKRDVEPWGDAWRRGLMDPILGTEALVGDILEKFRADEALVMACSADFYKHGVRNSVPKSLEQLKILAAEAGLAQHLEQDWAFVAGTMFWIRPQILMKMARMIKNSEGYSTVFRRDGSIEHGLERLLGLSLYEHEAGRVAVVSMDGTITETGLGAGFSMEGVSQTMRRLHGE